MKRGLKTGVTGKPIKIIHAAIRMTKARIIRLGRKLKVRMNSTWSCYAGGAKPCGQCEQLYSFAPKA